MRMGFLGTIVVLDINPDVNAEQSDEKALTISCEDSKATVAGWSYLSKYIIAGHADGTVSQYDAKVSCLHLLLWDYADSVLDWRTIRQRTGTRGRCSGHRSAVGP